MSDHYNDRTFDMLELCCFPKGCLIDDSMQSVLATVLVPELEASGMKTYEWTRGALMLEEPHLTKVKGIVCRGCKLSACQHNPQHGQDAIVDDLMHQMYSWPYADRFNKNNRMLLEALVPRQFVSDMLVNGIIIRANEPSTSGKWFSMNMRVEHPTRGNMLILLKRKKGEAGEIAVYGTINAQYPLPDLAGEVAKKLREIIIG